ncbi:MAG: hypothetical protein A2020_13130 [Lentisphaerae bacterium GWF2_45_14]|nr:MAG: hypothetical protein A2020_13130 [Lentisphaerae bacterium GWF2_45_14]
MNIALIRKRFSENGQGGGAEKVAARFAAEFIKRGHSVTVVSQLFDAKETESLRHLKVRKNILPSICGTSSFHKNARKALTGHKFDIVYSMCRTYPVDVFRVTEQLHSEWLKVGYGPMAFLNPRHRKILSLERKTLNPANTRHVVTNSELVREQIIRNFAFPPDRISVVRNGVDKNIFSPARSQEERFELKKEVGLPQDKLILLFTAANFRIKGLEEAIRACAALPSEMQEKIVLAVIGGDRAEPYLKTASALGFGKNIIFIGKSKRMRDFYACSDLLLYPSMYEPFANVCLEACACALPVLTTRLNGSSELIREGENGFLMNDSSEIEKMTAAIYGFASFPTERRESFRIAALDAVSDYSWEKHAAELEKIFNRLMDK